MNKLLIKKWKTKGYEKLFIIGLIVALLGLGINPVIGLADDPIQTTITVVPASATMNYDEILEIQVWVNNVDELYGADVILTFDPTVLEVIDEDPSRTGVQIQNGGFLEVGFMIYNYGDNINGVIRYTNTQLNPTPAVTGSGKLFVAHIKAKKVATSHLTFSKWDMSDRNGNLISATTQPGIININPPPSPVLSIAKLNASDARLSWTSTSGAVEYHLYRDTTPYFTPGDTPYKTLTSIQYDDLGALGDPAANYFYTVKAVCPNGFTSNPSNRVGEFDFSLLRNADNTIALPLIDSSLQTADHLGTVTASSKVSEWVAETSSFRTRLVGLMGANFVLQTGHGYFVRTNADSSPTVFTTVGGVPEPGAITFSIYRQTSCKLNLISIPLDHPELNSALKLATSMGGVPKISEWIASTGSLRTYIPPIGPINFVTSIGYPYWPCADTSAGGLTWP